MPVSSLAALGVLHHHFGRLVLEVTGWSMASAASYGLAAVLQHHAAIREPPEMSMRFGLLAGLVRRPLWLVGSSLDAVGYLLQFLALRRGSLALVEPVLALSLVFALPVGAWLEHRTIRRGELAAAAVVTLGLALFLRAARPGLGHPRATGLEWVVLSATLAAVCVGCYLGARGGSPARAAVLLAAGSGTAFGYVAAVTERTGHLLDRGVLHTLGNWSPYGLLVGGVVAMTFTQSAFHAGALRLSLPTLTVAQPLVAVAIGLGFFGEHISTTGIAPVVEMLSLVLVTGGVFSLGRSPGLVS
ncbi:MAG TPA: DMT family transporter [Acidimicrobiales bacterium]|nr:DMT family transporter [Acidimicrobiales bacterium]